MQKVNLLIIFWVGFFLLTIQSKSLSQERIGLSMDNYSGIWGAQINPALMTQNKVFLDVNIIGSGFHFSNNFAYILKNSNTFFGPFPIDTATPTYGDNYYNGYYTYYRNKYDKWMFLDSKIMGPSIMFQDNKHSFGFSTSVRTAISAVNFPWEIPVFLYENLGYEPLHNQRFNDKDFGFTELTWEEMAFSYAYELQKSSDHSISFGITAKLLFGISGLYNTNDIAEYTVLNEDSIYFHLLNSDIGYSITEPVEPDFALLNPFKSNGFGVGFDMGFVYVKKRNNKIYSSQNQKACAAPYQDYFYRIGFSLIDIGSIHFSKFSGLHSYHTENAPLNINDMPEFESMTIDEYMHYLSKELTGNYDSSYVKDNITIGLPGAANFQFDWHINNPFYVSLLMVHPLHLRLKDLRRPAQIAVTPRYETQSFGISLPVSLINYKVFRTGVSLRFYNFVVGTESLRTLLDMRNLDNIDVYFGIKINLKKGRCDNRLKNACSFSW